ncbi:MAG: YihY/virulence factor BrkB family protein [Rubrivivax sp.]
MNSLRQVRVATGSRVGRALVRVPGLLVLMRAAQGYVRHQSATQAGSVAFSMVLSMFPLLLLVAATAAYIGRPGDAAELATRIVSYTPPVVREALQPVVDQVLAQRNQALLAIGLLVTMWTASSGMQAVRTALNKAYGVEAGLSFWRACIKVTLFTAVVGLAIVVAFSSVVITPYVWLLIHNGAPAANRSPWLHDAVRYGLAYVVLSPIYALTYGWLHDLPQRLRTVVPGALIGAALWIGAAALLSKSLRSAGKLLLVYGEFAGLVATLVFLYASAATLIFGAEVNAVLRKRLPAGTPSGPTDPAGDSPIPATPP